MTKSNIKNLILVLGALLAVCAAVWIPGKMQNRIMKKSFSEIKDVPQEYYAGPSESVISNVSKQLTDEQCLELILGRWKSSVSPARKSECTMTDFDIKTMAVLRIRSLYNHGMYPVDLSSDYRNWYSWSATPYKAIDTTFRTYVAIYWCITFTRYDNTELHKIVISERGDILYTSIFYNQKALEAFTPELSNSEYMLTDDSSVATLNLESKEEVSVFVSITESDTYSARKAGAEEKRTVDTSEGAFYLEDFESFKPDDTYIITAGAGDAALTYSASYIKTDNTYELLLLAY
ncbi:MAG: hypothetical protein K6E28_04935 [Eubacterium sp.]|nr:hypothetical protein [Eubacterium sp.]